MALIDRAILKQLVLVAAIGGSATIMIMVFLKAGGLLLVAASSNVSWRTLGSVLIFSVPDLLALLMPLLTFGTVLWIYAKAVDDREIAVLQAAGVSPARMGRAAVVFSLLTVAVAWSMTLWLIPLSYGAFKDREHDIRAGLASAVLQSGQFNPIGRHITIFFREGEVNTVMRDVVFYDTRQRGRTQTIIAQRAWMDRSAEELGFLFEDGSLHRYSRRGSPPEIVNFDRFSLSADAASLGFAARSGRGINERPVDELLFAEPAPKEAHLRPILRAHGHHQLAQPLLCVMLTGLALWLVIVPAPGRRGAPWWRWPAALGIGAANMWLVLAAVSAAESDEDFLPLIWAAVLLPGGLAWWHLLRGMPRRHGSLRAARQASEILAPKSAGT